MNKTHHPQLRPPSGPVIVGQFALWLALGILATAAGESLHPDHGAAVASGVVFYVGMYVWLQWMLGREHRRCDELRGELEEVDWAMEEEGIEEPSEDCEESLADRVERLLASRATSAASDRPTSPASIVEDDALPPMTSTFALGAALAAWVALGIAATIVFAERLSDGGWYVGCHLTLFVGIFVFEWMGRRPSWDRNLLNRYLHDRDRIHTILDDAGISRTRQDGREARLVDRVRALVQLPRSDHAPERRSPLPKPGSVEFEEDAPTEPPSDSMA